MEKNKYISLDGQGILITGVSRPSGIGATLVQYLANAGAQIVAHGFPEYDKNMNYLDANTSINIDPAKNIHYLKPSDLSVPGEAEKVVYQASEILNNFSGLILNHAYSTHSPIGEWTWEHINNHMLVNVTASMIMIQEFTKYSKGGCITLFTSGQYQGPMISEVAYAVSKEAIRGLSYQASSALAPQGIRVNCVNPGPVDTGYSFGDEHKAVANLFPSKRWGTPNDTAKLINFLHSDQANWITGQTIASDGGFNR